ncbi:aminotransferase class V-fold PLP-dependent enzyme [Kineosporia sp. NBRC 101731]|uniref:aminotransferase class I/II-fold pyridoxal phosphate-dependent enzyme n=1 Tax=Kineosporia sp. NBRC 101731 TaxID=3032199 RepID=UPI0025550ECC|nr:aminotransferase class V-fold PLP-dependent enzyme [Kineosporia sp. NBRC 101731]
MTSFDPLDPLGLADDAPLFAAWLRMSAGVRSGSTRFFSIPGHKQSSRLTGPLVDGDLPLYAGLDTVQLSGGLLAEAEQRAAALWGVDWCRFSVGGSTHANQAVALAVGAPGDTVIVSRTLHRSMLTGLILAGLRPVWVHPELDERHGLPLGVPREAVAQALAHHPEAKAVLVGDPSYVGTTGDIAGLASTAHAAGVPLIVDGAWAAHFGFHPGYPTHALALGADALVLSAHKTLPAMNQAALLLARTSCASRAPGLLDPSRLERGFEAGHTTSPSGAILASIDASRALLQHHGDRLLGALFDLRLNAVEKLREVPGLEVMTGEGTDPAKLVIRLPGTGACGLKVDARLRAAGFTIEMADRDTLVPMLTLADEAPAVDALVSAIITAVDAERASAREAVFAPSWRTVPVTGTAPREAFFAPHETVGALDAVGRVSAELIAPYPPGVPVLAPGEVITQEIVDALRQVAHDGGRIAYVEDPTLTTFQVVGRTPTSGR